MNAAAAALLACRRDGDAHRQARNSLQNPDARRTMDGLGVRMVRFLRQFWNVMNGSGDLGKGLRLERDGRLADARVALRRAADAGTEVQFEFLRDAYVGTRLTALTRLACIAANLKEEDEAVRYAREGLALWSEARLAWPRTRDVQFFVTWESWARAYLAGGRR